MSDEEMNHAYLPLYLTRNRGRYTNSRRLFYYSLQNYIINDGKLIKLGHFSLVMSC